MSQDDRQLDSSLICRVILSLIQSNPSVSIPVLQGAVQASYHFKPSYRKGREVQSQLAAINRFSQRLLAAIEKNRKSILKMRVTHCDRRAFVFIVEELESFEGWEHDSFRVRLSEGTCDCGLFQSLYYPCRHTLSGCAAASIEWAPYVHPVYRQEAVFKVYEMGFPPIPDESLWAEWHGTMLRPNLAMRRKATGRPVSTRFRNDMDDVERQEKRCALCRQVGHTRRGCPKQPTGDA
ncbi:hypothetical protein Ahy_B09g098796 [Arachis hypogaea]|uniref:SWIM-type domain-containing protein n=1 Tax=Arachis hypogaea TaxID=3818 RepID=A0A444XS68_ARAHY|nr:hypothetical protein Ahy_B09g098796 [Arachis hypogaea]